MKKYWKEGDKSHGVCARCERLVETEFEYRTYSLENPRVDVDDVLVAVCTVCDGVVAVPYQSSPKLNAARKASEAPLEARIPRHLEDILGVVASHYGRYDSEFRAVVVRFYLHALGQNQGLAQHIRKLSSTDLARGKALSRVSLKVQEPVLESAWSRAQMIGLRTKTDMVRGVILAAAEDLEGREGKQRREALEEMAAST